MTQKHSFKGVVTYDRMWIVIPLVIGMAGAGRAGNVLYVAPSVAISHYQMLEPLMLNLAKRGHNVTVMSHYPQKEKIPNYTDIDITGMFPKFTLEFQTWNLLDDLLELFRYGRDSCETFASSEKVQEFLKTDPKFDLMFIETFDSDCLLGLAARLKAPYIIFSAMSLPVWEGDWIYNPVESAYLADVLCRVGAKMTFFDKLTNIGCQTLFRVMYWLQNVKPAVDITRKHFHIDEDSFDDLKRNVSFIFVNSFHGLTGVRPMLPNVLEIGGIHLKPRKPLPDVWDSPIAVFDFQKLILSEVGERVDEGSGSKRLIVLPFMGHVLNAFCPVWGVLQVDVVNDGAKHIEKFCTESNGVILFSMGSIVQAHTLDKNIKSELLSVFSKLKERVLWKWEEEFPDKPKNLMTLPWLPQSDVLGHPKVKVFISHGGIHGLYEAIYNGVPIIGIPLFGDQMGNLKALEAKGVAVTIDFPDLNGKTLSSALNKVLNNDSYRQNAQLLSKIFRDQPLSPLDKATFWTEYAIRHGGAPHFQHGGSHLSWIQYALIDVLLLCVSSFLVMIAVFYYSLKILRII